MLCCPASGGVCCAFSKTCCPPGTLCDADGLCSKANSGFFGLMNYFTSQKQIQTEAPTIESPVLKSCLTFCGDLCCGFKNGVCCDDGEHCCPSGYVCDGASQSCRLSLPDPIPKPLNGGRNCLFSKSDCRNSQTCCILTDGSKGCCPYQNADCCADGAHCCPEGTVCNSDSSACVRRSGAWVDPFKPSPKLLGRKSVVCPGGEVACNRGSTCCKSGAGGDSSYSCCPHENAVCCGDGEHCCPEGYTCDPTNGGLCVRLSSSVVPKSLKESRVGNECADGQSVCPDETTCCALESGKYACCPLPDAVCCEDHEHCCPNGNLLPHRSPTMRKFLNTNQFLSHGLYRYKSGYLRH
nr:granulin [Hymenolepis microstoma]